MRLFSIRSVSISGESGVSLIETAVVLAVLGTIAVTFLTGMMISSNAAFINDEQATAENLARSQMEWAQNASYISDTNQYPTAPIPGSKDYINYSVNITAQPLQTPDDGIQKVTVIVIHSNKQVIALESYKVNR